MPATDLMLAILSMDVYNRGGDGLNITNAQVGTATVNGIGYEDVSTGFFAINYTDGTDTILSYRGTDQFGATSPDIWQGWISGLGVPAAQIMHALAYYKDVTDHAITDGPQNVILTGHSLGGGLAGMIGALTGNRTVVFDNMPYGSITGLMGLVYGVLPSASSVTAYNVLGEWLTYARAAELPLATAVYGALSPQALMSAAILAQETTHTMLTHTLAVLHPTKLHSQALNVTLTYGNMMASQAWTNVADVIIPALFDDAVAAALGIAKTPGGVEAYDVMMRKIAYSAVSAVSPSGEEGMVFGNAAIGSLFVDANKLGSVRDEGRLSETTEKLLNPIGKLIVEHAGLQAQNKLEMDLNYNGPSFGIITTTNERVEINLSDDKWKWESIEVPPVSILGRKEMVELLVVSEGADVSAIAASLWTDGLDAVKKIDIAYIDSGSSFNLEPESPPDFVTLFVANDEDNTITGSEYDEFVAGGDGMDVIDLKEGNDFASGGDDDDTLKLGDGNNFGSGGEGTDTVDYSDMTTGIEIRGSSLVPHGLEVKHGSYEDNLVGIEKIIATSKTDTFKFSASDVHDGRLTGLHTLDAGSQESGQKDILDLRGLSGSITVGDTLEEYELEIMGFEQIMLNDEDNVLNTDQLGVTYILGSGADRIVKVGAGSVIYTGDGKDLIQWSQGGAVADLSADDRIVIGKLELHGGLRYKYSSNPYALGLDGLIEYGMNSVGELIIHLPWMPKITVEGANGPVTVDSDMFIPNYGSGSSKFGGLGDIWLAEFDVQTYRIATAPAGVDSIQSQIDLLGLTIKTIAGAAFWGGQDPLILDLDGDGFDLTYKTSISPSFDLDADFYAEKSAWVLPDDGFLVRDINGDGKINDGLEMFAAHGNGFDALATLDGNSDGVIDADDDGLADFDGDGDIDANDTFTDLKIWVDANMNGHTDAGELKSLADYDIVQLSLTRTPDGSQIAGNTLVETAGFLRSDGTSGTYGEVLLAVDNLHSTYVGPEITETVDAAARPDLKGYGTLVSLRQALSEHPELLTDVDTALAAIAGPSMADLKEAILPVLYAWAMGSPLRLENGTVLEGNAGDPRNYELITYKDGDGVYLDYIYDFTLSIETILGVDHSKGVWNFQSGAVLEILGPDDDPIPDPTTLYATYGAPASFTTGTVVVNGETVDQIVYTYANGAKVTLTDPGDFADTAIYGATANGDWDLTLGHKIAFYERYMGESFSLKTAVEDGEAFVGALDSLAHTIDTAIGYLAVRLAVQAGALSDVFSSLHYDAATDIFSADGDQQLAPVFESLFELADLELNPIAYLEGWKPFLDILVANYSQGSSAVLNTFGFLSQNIVAGFEAAGATFDMVDAAVALGIDTGLFVTGSGTIAGTNDPDIFYLDGSGQTAQGGKGYDTYIVGADVGTTIIDDIEPPMDSGDDVVRFTAINPDDIVATRDGADLILTVDGTGDTLTIKDQFTGGFPALIGSGNLYIDHGVTEIVFADGTVWTKMQMAMAVARPLLSGGTQTGTSAIDYFISGTGDDTWIGLGSSDIYEVAPGTGDDVISDHEDLFTRNSYDIVRFTGGIGVEDLIFSRDGASDDLVISFVGETGSVTIEGQFTATETMVFGQLWMDQLEMFIFDSGYTLTAEEVRQLTLQAAQTSGNDEIYGYSTVETITGGEGDDFLSGRNGDDVYIIELGDGEDEIFENNTNLLTGQTDTIAFGEGIGLEDLAFARSGTDDLVITIGGSGQSLTIDNQFVATETGAFGVWWANRIENFTFADEGPIDWSDVMEYVIAASQTSNADTIYGFHLDDTLEGGTGDDYMSGANGNDTYIINLGDGEDTIFDDSDNLLSGQDDTIRFGAGIELTDLAFSRVGSSDDLLITIGSSGQTVTVEDQFGIILNWWSNRIETFEFDDNSFITWLDVMETLIAQSQGGNYNTVYGFSTPDTLTSSAGDDFLSGLDGDDIYEISLTGGQDEIFDNNTYLLSGQDDTIEFGAGIALGDLTFHRHGASDDLLIEIGSGGQTLKIRGQFAVTLEWWPNQIETFVFDDTSFITAVDVMEAVIDAAQTAGSDAVYGFHAGDMLEGGAGNDFMSGLDGDDTYVIGLGDGSDTIYDHNTNLLTGQDDTLVFGPGITQADVSFGRDGNSNDLLIQIGTTGQSVKIQGQFFITLNWWANRIETFAFDDTSTISAQEVIESIIAAHQTAENDTIYGFATADEIDGGFGSDYANGQAGNDIYHFGLGSGRDTVEDPDGTDTVHFGAGLSEENLVVLREGDDAVIAFRDPSGQLGSDRLRLIDQFDEWQNSVIEHFTFEDDPLASLSRRDLVDLYLADARTSGDDTITGTQGADIISGGLGNDLLRGQDGDDTYLFNLRDGQDTITDYNGNLNYSSDDTVQFGDGIDPGDIEAYWQGSDLVLKIAGRGESLQITSYFGLSYYDIENFVFADTTVWDRSDIMAIVQAAPLAGTVSSETLTGTAGPDAFDGAGGTDHAIGNGGGSLGDIFFFDAGYGQLKITELDWAATPNNTLQFGAGIDPLDVVVTADGNDVLFTIGIDQVRVVGMYGLADHGVQQVVFADTTVWTAENVIDAANSAVTFGTTGNDNLTGSSADDIFDGLGGNDVMHGAGGDDTFVFNAGYGHLEVDALDIFHVYQSKLRLGAGITADDIVVTADSSQNVFLTIGTGGDQVKLKWQLYQEDYGVDTVVFDDGTVWDRAEIALRATTGTSGNDTLSGTDGADVFDGKGGTDIAYGNEGNDTFIFNAGYGSLRINEVWASSSPLSKVQLGTGITPTDVLVTADSANNIYLTIGNAGDQIKIDSMNDNPFYGVNSVVFADSTVWSRSEVLSRARIGTYGSDAIYGSSGADVIDGKGGGDVIFGNGGSDTIVFKDGYGQLEITQVWAIGTLKLGYGINPVDVVITTDVSNDVTLTIGSNGDAVKINDVVGNSFYGVATVTFANGAWLTRAQLLMDRILGTDGNDTFSGTSGSEILEGGGGTDVITGAGGDDIFMFNVGYGSLEVVEYDTNPSAANILQLGVGLEAEDFIVSSDLSGHMTLYNSVTEDTIILTSFKTSDDWGVQAVMFADSTVWDREEILDLDINAMAGNDNIIGTSGADVLDGEGGDDYMEGLDGADDYHFGLGYAEDEIYENSTDASVDQLILGAGIATTDVILSRVVNDLRLLIAGEPDLLTITDYFNTIGHVEEIVFADTTVWDLSDVNAQIGIGGSPIYGTSSSETLNGTSASELINGLGGNDALNGGSGSDEYVFTAGSGNDTITENSGSGDTDIVDLSNEMPADIVVSRPIGDTDDLYIDLAATNERLFVDEHFTSTTNGIELIRFSDNSTWNRAAILANALFRGTSGADNVTGTSADETFDLMGGNDTVNGSTGSDTYIFKTGSANDTIDENGAGAYTDTVRLTGLDLADVLISRDLSSNHWHGYIKIIATGETLTLDDQFYNGGMDTYRVEQFVFDDVTLNASQLQAAAWYRGTSGNETITGTADAETFEMGGGNDTMNGSTGSDTYIYKLGSGNDTIDENGSGVFTDVVRFDGLDLADVEISRQLGGSHYHALIKIISSGEILTVDEQFYGSDTYRAEQFIFDDATLNVSQLQAAAWYRGTSSNETITGTADAETFDMGGGNDTINGSTGSDTYIYKLGSGNDTIDENGSGAFTDVVRFDGLDLADVEISRQLGGNHWHALIKIISSGEILTVDDQFYGSETYRVEQFIFDDTTLSVSQLQAAAWYRGTSSAETITGSGDGETYDMGGGDDTINGYAGADTIIYKAGSGNDIISEVSYDSNVDTVKFAGLNIADLEFSRVISDTMDMSIKILSTGEVLRIDNQFQSSDWYRMEQFVFADTTVWNYSQIVAAAWYRGTSSGETVTGSTGADTFDLGAGNDTANGANGADTHIYAAGYGNDVINESGDSATDTITLVGLNPGDVQFSRVLGSSTYMQIKVLSSGETLTVNNQFLGAAGYAMEQVIFADTTVWNLSQMSAAAWYRGTNSGESVTGTSADETFDLGAGNDTANGANGADTHIYAAGYGNDVINENGDSATDTIKLVGLNPGDVEFSRVLGSSTYMSIKVLSSGETLTVNNQFLGAAGYAMEQVIFANSTVWNSTQIREASWYRGSASGETLAGTSNGESFDAKGGNDTINADWGDDLLIGGAGADTLNGDLGTDTASYETATAGLTADLTTPANNTGDAAGDTYALIENLTGSNYADTLKGNSSANKITGGTGNDTLTGAGGADVFYFRTGFGADTITDFGAGSGTDDVIQLDDDIVDNYVDLLAAASTVGSDTLLDFGSAGSILLTGVSLGSLDSNDFLYVA
jgi:Ca2+-binding RTX toxin-like protein